MVIGDEILRKSQVATRIQGNYLLESREFMREKVKSDTEEWLLIGKIMWSR